ncbi:MAG: DUF4426 domain-containing protein [Gammaproteobacteria bacterium]|nr:DUF4426 domain-containing protein [Gammaproteobacteria bacterium]
MTTDHIPGAALACALILLTTTVAGPVRAEQMVRFGDLEIHYIALNTTTLAADMAERYDVPRADNRALVNIAGRRVQADGTTEPAPLEIRGKVTNLLEQMEQLEFREVRESGGHLLPGDDHLQSTGRCCGSASRSPDPATGETHPLEFRKDSGAVE